ncbi:MAG TPA: aldo/keto reductase, partial [Coriobacteriia bacterium]|nr:aldo/keto reductase [Coriobacteriia bacterium]
PYSAVEREHEMVISDAARSGAGVIVRGGAARGAPSRDERAVRRNPRLVTAWERAELQELLDGMSPMEFTLRFTLSHPDMTTTIVGTANPEHLAANIDAASRGPLPEGLYAEAGRRLGEAAV